MTGKAKTMPNEIAESAARPQPAVPESILADAATGALQSPFCCELRSKKYYTLQGMPTEEHHLLDASRHCWCRKTMQAAGPDGERVQPADCRPGRACYISFLAE
jgi:hypothetical protein